ncbi:hypothetical protein Metbo_1506 [Methanobacterium lacus]|uniref:Uncharacterized protein n=1 Tax=Methanobacterium lacus (strain AL-21) TaxID=877455 RepID=F0T8I7_METLA|nr:hypothetical protein [Methanobacterium lacus]ADZ09738.1 hypothetical protein Metbo_1506 [Methanobacterium lacus]
MKTQVEISKFIPEVFEFNFTSISFPYTILKYENGMFKCGYSDDEESIVPTEEDWAKFWKKLDRINAWDWAGNYVIPEYMYLDGNRWNIRIQFGDKKIECNGSNAYPGKNGEIVEHKMIFRRFFMAITKLLDIKTVDLKIETV